jgi:NAD-dependent dihydropyrimidine dehydrogenase PreA subunit
VIGALLAHSVIVRWANCAMLENADACTGCSLCEPRCPFNAIAMHPAAQMRPPGTA